MVAFLGEVYIVLLCFCMLYVGFYNSSLKLFALARKIEANWQGTSGLMLSNKIS